MSQTGPTNTASIMQQPLQIGTSSSASSLSMSNRSNSSSSTSLSSGVNTPSSVSSIESNRNAAFETLSSGRPSLKSNLKSSKSVDRKSKRASATPTVRFVDPSPEPEVPRLRQQTQSQLQPQPPFQSQLRQQTLLQLQGQGKSRFSARTIRPRSQSQIHVQPSSQFQRSQLQTPFRTRSGSHLLPLAQTHSLPKHQPHSLTNRRSHSSLQRSYSDIYSQSVPQLHPPSQLRLPHSQSEVNLHSQFQVQYRPQLQRSQPDLRPKSYSQQVQYRPQFQRSLSDIKGRSHSSTHQQPLLQSKRPTSELEQQPQSQNQLQPLLQRSQFEHSSWTQSKFQQCTEPPQLQQAQSETKPVAQTQSSSQPQLPTPPQSQNKLEQGHPATMPITKTEPAAPETKEVPAPQPKKSKSLKRRLTKRFTLPPPQDSTSSPVSKKEHRKSAAPQARSSSAPAVPVLHPNLRTTSYQSTQSAPASGLSAPLTQEQQRQLQQKQYNPLEHYVPCLHPDCGTYYTPMQFGPTFYSPQAPYHLARHRGLCFEHANTDLMNANETCKATWESMRQNAGRKTLGTIAREYDAWLESFRIERSIEGRLMDRRLKKVVLGLGVLKNGKVGPVKTATQDANPATEGGDDWDWRYTPRPCTKKDCDKPHYSPFSSRSFLFYATPRHTGFLPLPTLCPGCARADVEEFEYKVEEKRNSRIGGWDDEEWVEWIGQLERDREMECEFWEKAQERVVREKGVLYRDVETELKIRKEIVTEKAQSENEGEKSKGKGKSSEALKDLCVVM